MRILFLNRAYLPDVEATGQYLAELVEDLSPHHEVSVLCGQPNQGELDGRLFPYRRERLGPAEIWRAWGTRWPKGVPLGRMLNQASFYGLAGLAARRVPRPDVVVSLTDPPFLGLLALRLKRRLRVPFVYWCMDIYPDVAEAVGMAPGPLAAAFNRVQRRVLAGADAVVALADDMAARLADKGAADGRIRVIRNWADTRAIRPLKSGNRFRAGQALGDKFVVMYSGNFGYVWDLEAVLDAARLLREDERVAFVLIGDGSTRAGVEGRVRAEGLTNVRMLPYQARERLAESLSAADLHLVPLRQGVYGTVVPSKVYGILASGTPVAALSEREGEAARVVREHRCGWCGEPGDVAGLAGFIRSAASQPGRLRAMGGRARAAAECYYARPQQTAQFRELLEKLVAERGSGLRTAT
jgi:colanic acid biosynthesis glycosyl transferase WcaI